MTYRRQQSPIEASNAALSVRVDSLAGDISRINSKLDNAASADDVRALAGKIDRLAQPSTPQYTTWIAAAGLVISIMVGFFTLGISPVKEAIAKNEADSRIAIERVEAAAQGVRKELTEEFKEIRSAVVPRGEHEQRWRSFEASLANVALRLDETRKTLGDLYSPKDALKDLQKQIDDIRGIQMKPRP